MPGIGKNMMLHGKKVTHPSREGVRHPAKKKKKTRRQLCEEAVGMKAFMERREEIEAITEALGWAGYGPRQLVHR
jgi:hypothetical protein